MKHKLLNLLTTLIFASTFLTANSQSDTVIMTDFEFIPGILEVAAGTEVVWINNGAVVHTSESGEDCHNDGIWNSGDIQPGESYSRVFDMDGSYPYFCDYHCLAGMTGYVDVGNEFGLEDPEAPGLALKSIGPLPAYGIIHLDLEIIKSGNVEVAVFDLKGMKILTVVNNRELKPGVHSLTIDGSNLNPGLYLCRIVNDEDVITRKISFK